MADRPESTEALIDKLVERSVEHAVFGSRRDFLKVVGTGTAAAALADVFPMAAAKALAQAKLGPPEKKDPTQSSSTTRSSSSGRETRFNGEAARKELAWKSGLTSKSSTGC